MLLLACGRVVGALASLSLVFAFFCFPGPIFLILVGFCASCLSASRLCRRAHRVSRCVLVSSLVCSSSVSCVSTANFSRKDACLRADAVSGLCPPCVRIVTSRTVLPWIRLSAGVAILQELYRPSALHLRWPIGCAARSTPRLTAFETAS